MALIHQSLRQKWEGLCKIGKNKEEKVSVFLDPLLAPFKRVCNV
jgi:hypothetical protein